MNNNLHIKEDQEVFKDCHPIILHREQIRQTLVGSIIIERLSKGLESVNRDMKRTHL